MIKSKPAALPLYYVSTHSLMAVVVLTVEVTLPATPPALSSGESATLRLPLSIINEEPDSFQDSTKIQLAWCQKEEGIVVPSALDFQCFPPTAVAGYRQLYDFPVLRLATNLPI